MYFHDVGGLISNRTPEDIVTENQKYFRSEDTNDIGVIDQSA
jgi:hypothetical protein